MKKIFISLLLVSTFVLINFDVIWAGASPTVFRDNDEAWYGIIAQRLRTQDCTGVPVTFAYPDRPNFHSCELLRIIGRTVPGESIITKTIWLKVGTRAVTLALLALLGYVLFSSALLGYLIGLVYFVDDGIPYLKPLVFPLKNLVTGELDAFTRSNRLISPMQYTPILFAFSILFVIWLRKIVIASSDSEKFQLRDHWFLFLLSLPATVLVSLTPFYAWVTHLYFVGAILLYSSIRFRSKLMLLPWLSLISTLALCVYQGVAKTRIPFREETLVRSGFFDQQFTPLFVGDKALLLSLAIFIILYWKLLRHYSILFAVGMFTLVNINILTGREYQNFHFRDTFGILIFLVLFWGAWQRFTNHRRALILALTVSFILGTTQYVRSQVLKPSELVKPLSQADASQIIEFFKQVEPRSPVMCGPFYEILPLTSNVVCSWHHLLMTYPLSNHELMEFHQAHFKVQGFSEQRVLEMFSLDASPSRSLGVWSYGVNSEWIDGLPQTQVYSVSNLQEKIIPLWIEDYKKYDVANAKKLLINAQYLILDNKSADEIGELVVPIKKFTVYGVYRWK